MADKFRAELFNDMFLKIMGAKTPSKEKVMLSKEYLPKAIKKVNELNEWVNNNILALKTIAKDAKTIKNGSELSKKPKEAFRCVTDTFPGGAGNRCFVSVNGGYIILNVDVNYPVKYHNDGGYTCAYYSQIYYLDNDVQFHPLPIYTIEQIEKDAKKLSKYKAELETAQNKYDETARKLKPFNN